MINRVKPLTDYKLLSFEGLGDNLAFLAWVPGADVVYAQSVLRVHEDYDFILYDDDLVQQSGEG